MNLNFSETEKSLIHQSRQAFFTSVNYCSESSCEDMSEPDEINFNGYIGLSLESDQAAKDIKIRLKKIQ